MQQRYGLATRWTAINPILEIGEFGFEIDTDKFKVGDGVTTWANLPYYLSETSLPNVPALIASAMDEVQTLVTTSVSTAVSNAVAGLVDSAPAALNTLNELAAAIADDSTFANTITNALANKADSGHTHTLDSLSDVSVSAATTGQVLQKNSDGSWGPASVSVTFSYNDLQNIPSTFTPSAHLHQSTDITNVVKEETGTSYSLLSSDAGKLVKFSNDAAITFTIDNALQVNQKVDVYRKGAGVLTFAPGAGVTLQGAGSTGVSFKMPTRYSAATIYCESSGVYIIIGNVETA
jgi:hypothetical protein